MADMVTEIKKLIKENKLILGGDKTIKGLRKSTLSKVYLASNCPDKLKQDIEHYASISGTAVVETGIQNTDLGDICKKPFAIAIMGLPK